jgi:hypothetical protein
MTWGLEEQVVEVEVVGHWHIQLPIVLRADDLLTV